MSKTSTSMTLTDHTLAFLNQVSNRNGISKSELMDILSDIAVDYFESTGTLDNEIRVRRVIDGRSARWIKDKL